MRGNRLGLVATIALAGCSADAGVRRAEAATARYLRDPGSARFAEEDVHAVAGEPGTYLVCGTVNARNGFGGMAGARRFIATIGGFVFVEDDHPGEPGSALAGREAAEGAAAMDDAWRRYCSPATHVDRGIGAMLSS